MSVRFLTIPAGNRILGRFQLHNHSGETLGEGIVNVARHSISFFEDRRALALLGKLIELKREHYLVGKRLGQFDLLRPIRRTIDMADANKAFDLSTHQKRHCQKPLSPVSFQILTPLAINAGISLDVVANDRTCRKEQFPDYRILLPQRWVLDEWMFRTER